MAKGLGKFLNDAEFQAILVRQICEEFDELNPRLVRFVLKRAAPLVAKASGKSMAWLGKVSQQRLTKILKLTPGYANVMSALEQVLATADLAQRAEQELAAIRKGTLRRNEAEHLDFLSSDLKRHAEILHDLDDIKVGIEKLLNPQPPLRLDIITQKRKQRRFVYGTRYVEFQGRRDEIAQLDAFINAAPMVSWHLITGSGGQGKSRLALEFCLQVGGAWRAGFLSANTTYDHWEDWRPDQPTLIVVDYVARRGEAVGQAIRHAAANAQNYEFPVRFLLLERDMQSDDEWAKQFWGPGRTDQISLEDTCHRQKPIELADPGPDELWTIMQGMNATLDETRREECLEKLSTIDKESRALYAAFLGEALTANDNVLEWSTTDLAREILQRDQENFWPKDVTEQDENLLALATMTAGTPIEALGVLKDTNLFPALNKNTTFDRQGTITGHIDGKIFFPLEPDILGELFVLEVLYYNTNLAIKHPSRERHNLIRGIAWHSAPTGMNEFLVRCARDFPNHKTMKTLSMPLDSPGDTPEVIAASLFTIGQMSDHLSYAGEGGLLHEHTLALCNAFQNDGHMVIQLNAAFAAPREFGALHDTSQPDLAQTLFDELSILADKHPDIEGFQAPKAAVTLLMISDIAINGRHTEAQLLLYEAVNIARRFPAHFYSQIVLTAAPKAQELLARDYQARNEDSSDS
ncbi:MAG: hypothetical protein JKY27_05135 [Magnetovibrio sp.]|nr:hypothetical protein [Magnetovibrio sp.]